jgi:hypothetical protein
MTICGSKNSIHFGGHVSMSTRRSACSNHFNMASDSKSWLARVIGQVWSAVDVGTPLVVIENYWAVMTLKANGKGILRKTFFERGTSVKIGDPIAIENDFVVVTGTGTARDFIRLLTVELH